MKLFAALILVAFSTLVCAQEYELEWRIERRAHQQGPSALTFEGAAYSDFGLPQYAGIYNLPNESKVELSLFYPNYEALTSAEIAALGDFGWLVTNEQSTIDQTITEQDGQLLIRYTISTIRRNPENQQLEKLVTFDLLPEITGDLQFKTSSWAQTSVLGAGTWAKVPIRETALHKIEVSQLISAGVVANGAPSTELRAYHNGGGMLPEQISADRVDDLRQINIFIEDGGDDKLNSGDVVYFYAEGPDEINVNINAKRLSHSRNVYARESYVFFTSNTMGSGLRVREEAWGGGSATLNSMGFDDIVFIEEDLTNIARTGREWYGQIFDFQLNRQYTFNFPNRIVADTMTVRFRGAADAPNSTTRFEVSEGGNTILTRQFSGANGDIAFTSASRTEFFYSTSNNITLDLTYNRSQAPTATGYLDYLSVQARRTWDYASGGFVARDLNVIQSGAVVLYNVSDLNAMVWDVTDPTRPFMPQRNASGDWLASGDSLRTYAVFKPSDALAVSSLQSVPNQNLHAETDVDMLIVSHPDFLSEAQRLANFHLTEDGIQSLVVTPEQIYNEFSGGAQDITAIRDLARMLYKRNTNRPLEYLMLVGDASFDYLNRVPNMNNFVPIFESVTSSSLYSSFMTDDYYGCLDDSEGNNVVSESVDIQIGRLPVKSMAEATAVVDKIVDYGIASNTFGDWRNRICFVTDDVDESWEARLTRSPENVAQEIDTVYPFFNFEKIYADSYTQVSTSGSQSYPAAREALYRSVQRGNLVTAYTGHGGEVGWSSERLLQLQDINNWTNKDALPLFVTITCEFTRLDDPFRTSAGEQLFLNPDGGAMGLISTTRVVFVEGALELNDSVFTNIFKVENGQFLTLGEIVRRAKNAVSDGDRVRFSLIGDPALRLNIPPHNVSIDSVNGVPVAQADTMRARETVTFSGSVHRAQGGLFSNFDGEVTVTVFDKAVENFTKKNDGVGSAVRFIQQENVIFRGRATVTDGLWEITFVVPRDINYTFGEGKISLYAENGDTDAKGANRGIIVGGLGQPLVVDNDGPEIRLFMNDTNFVNGGLTSPSPTGLALIFDESGINVVGNGLGHNVIGILDNDAANSFELNAYYEGDLDTYKSGQIEYPFFNLSNGPHTLKVRVWDVMNNVSEAEVDFVVASRNNLVIEDLFNYPNPFSDITNFSFEHNREGDELEVQLYVSDLNGRIVHHQSQNITPEGSRTLNMTWDGSSGNGSKVSTGVYVFRLVVRSLADGSEAQLSERLVYLK